MKSLESYVEQMNHLLSELVQTATQLRDLSLQVISEEDLMPLQKYQEELLSQLEEIDKQTHIHYQHQIDVTMKANFHHQLQIFQQLNQEFIQNLNSIHGLIQFELNRLPEERDFSHSFRLNKIFSAPNSSEAINPQEDKET